MWGILEIENQFAENIFLSLGYLSSFPSPIGIAIFISVDSNTENFTYPLQENLLEGVGYNTHSYYADGFNALHMAAKKNCVASLQYHLKIEKNGYLRDYVVRSLEKGWSPEQISGRMKLHKLTIYVCQETIYQFVYRSKNKELCETHSPWQKGSNENMSGRLRWYLPRETDIAKISQENLDQLAAKMNRCPEMFGVQNASGSVYTPAQK